MVTFKPAYCSSHIALLVREHFNLKSTIVTGIPMKVLSLSLMRVLQNIENYFITMNLSRKRFSPMSM